MAQIAVETERLPGLVLRGKQQQDASFRLAVSLGLVRMNDDGEQTASTQSMGPAPSLRESVTNECTSGQDSRG